MLVICSVNTDTTDPDVIQSNLYQKSAAGTHFPAVIGMGDDNHCSSSTKLTLISDAVFSNTINKQFSYWVRFSVVLFLMRRQKGQLLLGSCFGVRDRAYS